MNQHSYCFREADFQELLTDQNSPQSQFHALKFINKSQDLFNSHFCDEQFYVPIRKKSACFHYDDFQKQPLEQWQILQLQSQQGIKQNNKQQNIIQTDNGLNKSKKAKQKQFPLNKNQKMQINNQLIMQKQGFTIKTNKIQPLEMILIDKQYFIKSNGIVAQINKDSLQYIMDEFNKHQLFIPIFQYARHNQWQNSHLNVKFEVYYEPHNLYKYSIHQYFIYLHQQYSTQLNQILIKITEGKHLRSSYIKSSNIFHFVDQTLNLIKSKFYTSKLQILKQTLLAKIRSINIIRQQITDEIILLKQMRSEEENIWKQIGQIQFLIILQQTEKHCTKKIKETEQKEIKEFWTNYRIKIKKQFEKQTIQINQIYI